LYLESKLSCLDLAQRVPGFRVPPGVIAMSWEEVEGAVRLLLRRGSAAMVKAIHGVGGTGSEVLGRDGTETAAFWRRLAQEPYFRQFPLLVQEFIAHAPGLGCPAVDLNVGETGCREIFSSVMTVTGHRFQSVKVGPGILPASVDDQIVELGQRVGGKAAELGYRGWLGIDFLVSADGLVFATEINARRTTGMHPFALAQRWGVEKTVVRAESLRTLPGLAPCAYQDIRPAFQDMWRTGARVVPATVRCLGRQRPAFGIVTAASTPAETDAIADELASRIGRLSR
jgi:biotin carboxylase